MRTFCLVITVLLATGCSYSEVTHKPLETVGERKDVQGNVIQRIVADRTIYVTIQPLTPEGPHRSGRTDSNYYLEDTGKPRCDISWLDKADFSFYYESYLPVENSQLWLGVVLHDAELSSPVTPPAADLLGSHDTMVELLNVVVFNGERIVAQRKFEAAWIKTRDTAFRIEPGNRAITFRTVRGFKKYDVIANTVTDLESNPRSILVDPLP